MQREATKVKPPKCSELAEERYIESSMKLNNIENLNMSDFKI